MSSYYQKIPWPPSKGIPQLMTCLDAGELGQAYVVEIERDWIGRYFIGCQFEPREERPVRYAKVIEAPQLPDRD